MCFYMNSVKRKLSLVYSIPIFFIPFALLGRVFIPPLAVSNFPTIYLGADLSLKVLGSESISTALPVPVSSTQSTQRLLLSLCSVLLSPLTSVLLSGFFQPKLTLGDPILSAALSHGRLSTVT